MWAATEQAIASKKERPTVLCYPCRQRGVSEPAVALCRSCTAGLCLEHLRETASRLAASHILATCDHDTWAANGDAKGAAQHPLSGSS
jgi:hypothetical protein